MFMLRYWVLLSLFQWTFITHRVKAQTPSRSPSLSPSSIAPTPVAERPTNGPRRFPHESGPDHLRGNPIPTTTTPSVYVASPPVTPVTHAPNARRAPHPTPPRGPTYPPKTNPPVPGPPCFSGHNTVHIKGKGVVRMKDLALGDKVLDVDGTFVTVYSFGHYKPDSQVEYLLIYVQGVAKPLEISKEHLLFQHGKAIPASLVAVGSEVDVVGTEAPDCAAKKVGVVQKIQVKVRQGLFGPHTTSGTLVVNGVAVSSYISGIPNTGEVLLFDRYRTGLSIHWITHVYLTPHRWICTELVSVDYCAKRETYNDDGISNWAEATMTNWELLVTDTNPVTTKVMAFAYLLFSFWLALILYSLQQVSWTFALAVLVGPCVYYAFCIKRNVKSA